MFGSSKKQTIFTPTMYDNRRHRRMPRWLVTLTTGILIGAGGFWFLQTNYGPKRLSIDESTKLSADLQAMLAENQTLQNQLKENRNALETLRATQLATEASAQANVIANTTTVNPIYNPISPLPQQAHVPQAEDIPVLRQSLPVDPSNTAVGLRVGQFIGGEGQLSYDLVLTKRDENAADFPARVEIVAEGRYRNGRVGYAHLDPINITAGLYNKVSGTVKLNQATLTPRKVEVRVVNTQNRQVLGARVFEVTPPPEPTESTPATTPGAN